MVMPQREVAYLNCAPGLPSPWTLTPDRPFRPYGLLAWGWHPLRTVMQSFRIGDEDQLTQPCPASVFDSRLSLADFLQKALAEPVELAWPRVTLRSAALHAAWPPSRLVEDSSALWLPVSDQQHPISVAWTGELVALAAVGVQLL